VGASPQVHGVAMKPGKPFLFATAADSRLIFGLPGNPLRRGHHPARIRVTGLAPHGRLARDGLSPPGARAPARGDRQHARLPALRPGHAGVEHVGARGHAGGQPQLGRPRGWRSPDGAVIVPPTRAAWIRARWSIFAPGGCGHDDRGQIPSCCASRSPTAARSAACTAVRTRRSVRARAIACVPDDIVRICPAWPRLRTASQGPAHRRRAAWPQRHRGPGGRRRASQRARPRADHHGQRLAPLAQSLRQPDSTVSTSVSIPSTRNLHARRSGAACLGTAWPASTPRSRPVSLPCASNRGHARGERPRGRGSRRPRPRTRLRATLHRAHALGPASSDYQAWFMPSAELRERLARIFDLAPIAHEPGSSSRRFSVTTATASKARRLHLCQQPPLLFRLPPPAPHRRWPPAGLPRPPRPHRRSRPLARP